MASDAERINKSKEILDKYAVVFELLSDSMEEYLYMSDFQNDYSRWSKSAVDYFGLPGEYVENTLASWSSRIHPDDMQKYMDDFAEIVSGRKDTHYCEYRARNAMGDYVWVRCSGKVTRDEEGNPEFFIGTMANLANSGKYDGLTGLLSSGEFSARVAHSIHAGERGTALLLDADEFKQVNEIYGYSVGDVMLARVALDMKKSTSGKVFRMGGDKFAIVLMDADEDEIKKLFEDINAAGKNIIYEGENIPVSFSGGAVEFPKYGATAGEIIANAEFSLRFAKASLKNKLKFYSNEEHEKSIFTYRARQAIKESINNDFEGFYLVYQPFVSAKTGNLYGAEALLRFSTPGLKVFPDTFIPILEETGWIREVGEWTLRTALKQVLEWRKIVPDFLMSVNVSYIQMETPGFEKRVLEIVKELNAPADCFMLELTESCNVEEPDRLSEEFARLAEAGIKTALDDFGTGYASISMLGQLNPPVIKIDHTFVSRIDENKLKQDILEYIIRLADATNIMVVVEGIENQTILDVVKQYNPSVFQGYFYDRPLVTDEFAERYIK